ncbi:ABC transporter permease, partial [Roseateles sp. GG27B]
MSAFAQSLSTALQLVLEADPVLWRTVRLSLLVSGSACLFAAGFGLAAGAWLAVTQLPGRRALLALLD